MKLKEYFIGIELNIFIFLNDEIEKKVFDIDKIEKN